MSSMDGHGHHTVLRVHTQFGLELADLPPLALARLPSIRVFAGEAEGGAATADEEGAVAFLLALPARHARQARQRGGRARCWAGETGGVWGRRCGTHRVVLDGWMQEGDGSRRPIVRRRGPMLTLMSGADESLSAQGSGARPFRSINPCSTPQLDRSLFHCGLR